MYVPWRRVFSWHCSACGECCLKYKPKLTFYEYLKLKHTGFVEERANRYYIRKVNGKCPFQEGRLCTLQENKPLACKVFPFLVKKNAKDELALYEYEGEEFYVYVATDCRNTVLAKKPTERLEKLVREAVELVLGKKRKVEEITCKTENLNFWKTPKKRCR